MIRRLNYTGRLRILREDVRITITDGKDSRPALGGELDLSGYGLPEDARVLRRGLPSDVVDALLLRDSRRSDNTQRYGPE